MTKNIQPAGGPDDGAEQYGTNGASLLELINKHDSKCQILYDELEKIKESTDCYTTDEMRLVLSKVGAATLKSWNQITEYLWTEPDDKYGDSNYRLTHDVVVLFLEEEKTRVEILRTITPSVDYSVTADGDPDKLIEAVNEAINTSEEMVDIKDILEGMYGRSLTIDLNHFAEFIITERIQQSHQDPNKESPKSRTNNTMSKIGRHVLDVVKLAVGVGIGAVVNSALSRRRRN